MDSLSNQSSRSNRNSILKKNSNNPKLDGNAPRTTKSARFNEENIKETYRPSKKDYGFDKITEPKTPFEKAELPVDGDKLRKQLMELAEDSDDEYEESDNQHTSSSSHQRQKSNLAASSRFAKKKSTVSASVSVTSGDSFSFEEKRKKHIRAEFKVAKEAPKPEHDEI